MRVLAEVEYDEVWNAFERKFAFRPSVSGPFPGISEPPDSITFRLASNVDEAMLHELKVALWDAFTACGAWSTEIYYLDWQHECYAIDKLSAESSWVNGFPDGDYAILLAKDMHTGAFGHPWEQSICLFGDQFVKRVLQSKPRVLTSVMRNNGRYAA